MDYAIEIERLDTLGLDPESRSYRLREMCWSGTHEAARHTRPIAGCGENTLVGHARDFAALLEASASQVHALTLTRALGDPRSEQ